MPKMKFTKSEIDKLKFTTEKGEQVTYWDTLTPGLGLVVGARSKTFKLQLDVKDTSKPKGYRTVKKTLGRYGEITLEQAKAMMTGYIDQDTGEAVQSERLKLKAGETAAASGESVLLSELVESYFRDTRRKDGKERREKSALHYQKIIKRCYESWLVLTLKQVNELNPDVVMEKYQQLATSAQMTARNSTVMLSAVLNFGTVKYPAALQRNPLSVLSSRHVNIMKKIEPRHDSLVYDPAKKRNDFRIFLDSLSGMREIRRDLYLFTLYTGTRAAEASSLEWKHVNLEHAEITIPDTKNRQPLHVPVSRQALAILKRCSDKRVDDCQWVFPAVREIATNSKTGHAFLSAQHLKDKSGLDITIHGLRRTFTTIGRKLKRFEDTSRLTNHVDSSVEGKHYDETDAEDLRETCQMIGDTIERYMKESAGVVIRFPGMAKAA